MLELIKFMICLDGIEWIGIYEDIYIYVGIYIYILFSHIVMFDY